MSRVRGVLSDGSVRYPRRSSRVLVRDLGVSSQAVYAASSLVGRETEMKSVDLERWSS